MLTAGDSGLTDAHVGLFWRMLRAAHPKFTLAQSQPLTLLPMEAPQRSPSPLSPPPVWAGPAPQAFGTLARTWLLTDDQSHLIQIQGNYFALNWRRREADYPRFDQLLEDFMVYLGEFRALLIEEGLRPLRPLQLMVTYMNWIADLTMRDFLRPTSNGSLGQGASPNDPDQQNWAARYSMPFDSDQILPPPRLYVQCQPSVRPQPPILVEGTQFTLEYRVRTPDSISDEDVRAIFKQGRASITQAFTSLTTEAAHAHWERKQ